jgi:hypothetical protein
LTGLHIGGIGVGGERLTGAMIGPVGIGAETARGMILAGLYNKTTRLQGFGTGAFCRIKERLDGVTIGLINYTPRLNGVQIGLLNYAGNNPAGLKLLPLVNAHFD